MINLHSKWVIYGGVGLGAVLLLTAGRSSAASAPAAPGTMTPQQQQAALASQQIASVQDTTLGQAQIAATGQVQSQGIQASTQLAQIQSDSQNQNLMAQTQLAMAQMQTGTSRLQIATQGKTDQLQIKTQGLTDRMNIGAGVLNTMIGANVQTNKDNLNFAQNLALGAKGIKAQTDVALYQQMVAAQNTKTQADASTKNTKTSSIANLIGTGIGALASIFG